MAGVPAGPPRWNLERHTLTDDDWCWGVGEVEEGWQTLRVNYLRVNYRHVDRNY